MECSDWTYHNKLPSYCLRGSGQDVVRNEERVRKDGVKLFLFGGIETFSFALRHTSFHLQLRDMFSLAAKTYPFHLQLRDLSSLAIEIYPFSFVAETFPSHLQLRYLSQLQRRYHILTCSWGTFLSCGWDTLL